MTRPLCRVRKLPIRTLLRKTWLAAVAVCLVSAALGGLTGGWLGAAVVLAMGAAWVVALIRYGLLPLAVMMLVGQIVSETPMTTNVSDWYAPSMLTVLGIVLAITLWSLPAALGGRRVWSANPLDG